ncbi:MAG: ABC transporter permease [Flavobacteriales bacterium]|jgi:ABC-2 type transport system permease protein|tara:strand:+ start:571 stop:1929 length:1359 start_codon:yes stop_codon:yes gene_type:complete
MNKTSLIIKREYLTRVTKKSFLIVTFLVPFLFVAVFAGVIALGLSDSTNHNVLVVDSSGILSNNINGKIIPFNTERWKNAKDSSIVYNFTHEEMEVQAFLDSDYTLKISVDDQTVNDENVPMLYKELPSSIISNKIENNLQDDFQEYTWETFLNVKPEEYKKAEVNIDLVEQDAENLDVEDPHLRTRGWIGYGLSLIIYMTIFLFGSLVMRGVLEEKMSRIVEVLISSVKPFQLLMGKIIGVGLVGLTQFILWIGLFAVISAVGIGIISSQTDVSELAAQVENGSVISKDASLEQALASMGQAGDYIEAAFSMNWTLVALCFIFYFLGGYLLYGSLMAAAGSAVDAEADSQQFLVPITIPLIAAIMLSQLVIVNPESTIATVFSIFPLTSPIIMLVRVSMGSFEWWELALSMIVLIATFIGTVALAGKIYRTGILMYGKKVSYRELWKWLKY